MDSSNPVPKLPTDYQFKENPLTKSVTIHFPCPSCGTALVSKSSDAGTEDTCPECGQVFIVPGKEAIDAQRREERKKREAAEARQIAKKEAALRQAENKAQREAALWQAEKEALRQQEPMLANIENHLSAFGWVLVTAGVLILFFFGVLYDTTVETSGREVQNIGLLYGQMYGVHTGLALIMAGMVLCGLGPIEVHLRHLRWQSKE